MAGIQEVLKDPHLKLTQMKDVTWLSAVGNLRKCFTFVITSLEREAEQAGCFYQTYKFVALGMLSDVLPHWLISPVHFKGKKLTLLL